MTFVGWGVGGRLVGRNGVLLLGHGVGVFKSGAGLGWDLMFLGTPGRGVNLGGLENRIMLEGWFSKLSQGCLSSCP